MQQSTAAARPRSRRLRGLGSPPLCARALPAASGWPGRRRLGRGAQPGLGTTRALRASPPSRKGFFFLSPFPLPAIFRKGLPGGRGAGRCARCAQGRDCALWRHFAGAGLGGSSRGRPGWAWALREPCQGGSGGVAWGAAAAFAELWNDFALSRVTDYGSQVRRKPSSRFEISPKEYLIRARSS